MLKNLTFETQVIGNGKAKKNGNGCLLDVVVDK